MSEYSQRRQTFIEQAESVVSMDQDVAKKYQQQLKESGLSAVIGVIAINDLDVASLLWKESYYKLQPGDEIGPHFIQKDSGPAIRGLAIWRYPRQ